MGFQRTGGSARLRARSSRRGWLAAALLLLWPLPLAAQPGYDAVELARWHRLTGETVARTAAALAPADAALLATMEVALDERLIPGAFAVRDPDSGRRSILIFSGIAAGIDATIKMQMTGQRFGGCRERHSRDFFRFLVEEMQAVGPSAPLRQVPTVGSLFAGDPACREAARLLNDLPPKLGDDYDAMIAGSLAFLILHELGHHALGHQAPLGPAQSREQELAADAWALARLPKVVDPVMAFPALLFIARINWFDPTVETTMSHPQGQLRLLRLVETILAESDEPRRHEIFGRLRDRLLAGAEAPEVVAAGAAPAAPARLDR